MDEGKQAISSKLTDQQLARIIYSNSDFQQALSAVTFLLEECDFEAKYPLATLRRFRCYETSAVISFARPFESARGRDTLSLRSLGFRLTDAQKALKDRVMSLRRKVVAHSDEEFMHFRGTVIYPEDGVSIAFPIFRYYEALFLSLEELLAIEELLWQLIAAVTKAIFRIAQHQPDLLAVYRRPAMS